MIPLKIQDIIRNFLKEKECYVKGNGHNIPFRRKDQIEMIIHIYKDHLTISSNNPFASLGNPMLDSINFHDPELLNKIAKWI